MLISLNALRAVQYPLYLCFIACVHGNCTVQEGIDVLVATPGRISTLLEDGALSLADCRAVVLDEVFSV